MTKKNNWLKDWALEHPFAIVLSVIVIFYSGYTFGNWLYDVLH